MNLDDFPMLCNRTSSTTNGTLEENISHFILGTIGEFVEHQKEKLCSVGALEELGDMLWYLGMGFPTIQELISKHVYGYNQMGWGEGFNKFMIYNFDRLKVYVPTAETYDYVKLSQLSELGISPVDVVEMLRTKLMDDLLELVDSLKKLTHYKKVPDKLAAQLLLACKSVLYYSHSYLSLFHSKVSIEEVMEAVIQKLMLRYPPEQPIVEFGNKTQEELNTNAFEALMSK